MCLGIILSSVDEIDQHIAKVADGWACLICGKKMFTNSVRRHIKEQHFQSDSMYTCPACKKVFNKKRNFQVQADQGRNAIQARWQILDD